jgi:hypothetical protein
MKKLKKFFWPVLTIILSFVFAMLFYPIAEKEYGTLNAVLFTTVGLAVIWLVFTIRVFIFSGNDA